MYLPPKQKDIILKLFNSEKRLSVAEIEPLVSENCTYFIFESRAESTRASLIDYMTRLPDYFSVTDAPVAIFARICFNVKWKHFSDNAKCIVRFNDDDQISYFYLADAKQSLAEDAMMRASIIILSLLIMYLYIIDVSQ